MGNLGLYSQEPSDCILDSIAWQEGTMFICGHCGEPLEDGAKFCDACGSKVPDAPPPIPSCPKCGSPLKKATSTFCATCGEQIASMPFTPKDVDPSLITDAPSASPSPPPPPLVPPPASTPRDMEFKEKKPSFGWLAGFLAAFVVTFILGAAGLAWWRFKGNSSGTPHQSQPLESNTAIAPRNTSALSGPIAKNEAVPGSNPPLSTNGTDGEARIFMIEFCRLNNDVSNPEAVLTPYDEQVDLLNAGVVGKNRIRTERINYVKRWPEMRWDPVAESLVTQTDGDKLRLTFDADFKMANAERNDRIDGRSTLVLVLRKVGSDWKIISEKEKVINRSKGPYQTISESAEIGSAPPYSSFSGESLSSSTKASEAQSMKDAPKKNLLAPSFVLLGHKAWPRQILFAATKFVSLVEHPNASTAGEVIYWDLGKHSIIKRFPAKYEMPSKSIPGSSFRWGITHAGHHG